MAPPLHSQAPSLPPHGGVSWSRRLTSQRAAGTDTRAATRNRRVLFVRWPGAVHAAPSRARRGSPDTASLSHSIGQILVHGQTAHQIVSGHRRERFAARKIDALFVLRTHDRTLSSRHCLMAARM